MRLGRSVDKQKRRAKLKDAGICIKCREKPSVTTTFCATCAEENNKYQKKLRLSRLSRGLCASCNSPSLPGRSLCDKHTTKHRERRRNRVAKGLCGKCGALAVGGKMCESCRELSAIQADKIKQEVVNAYGGMCACCGEDNPLFLSIDHIHNNGAKHRRSLGSVGKSGGSIFYYWLKRHGFPQDDYQLLCHNCNQGKRLNGGICPHQQETGGIRACS